jgi:HEAT repeat protein
VADKDVATALGKLLVDESVPSNTRESSLPGLQQLGPKAVKFALPFLRKALKDYSPDPCRVIETIAIAGPEVKEAVPDLIKALRDKEGNYQVRVAAATALGQIGSAAAEAIPALKEAMMNDPGPPDSFTIAGTTGPRGTGEPVSITLARPPRTPAEKPPKDKEPPPLTEAVQEAIKKIKGKK